MTGWAAAGGHVLVDVVTETISGGIEPEDRPVMAALLDRLAAGEADALVVTTTDRCARTTAVHRLDYYGDRERWRLLILDALDRRNDPEAKLLHGVRVLTVLTAEYERALIARRTRIALAHRRRWACGWVGRGAARTTSWTRSSPCGPPEAAWSTSPR